MSEHVVRRATPADVPAIAHAMARAFAEDPLMTWVLPEGDGRVRRLEGWFAAVYRRVGLRHLEVYTTDPVMGAAEWAPPGRWRLPRRTALATMPFTLRWLGAGTWRLTTAMGLLERRHPTQEHWYLGGLGTDPDHQRRGVASALLRPVLDRCDTEGLPAYLETQKAANVPFYASHGFAVADEVDVPDGGPHLWLMWREPGQPPAAGSR